MSTEEKQFKEFLGFLEKGQRIQACVAAKKLVELTSRSDWCAATRAHIRLEARLILSLVGE